MEPGETIRQTAVREVKEETGYDVEVERLVGIYTDPERLAAYSDGEVRQEFSICFACRLVGGSAQESDESLEVAFFQPEELNALEMQDPIRLRIRHYLENRPEPYVS
jgi:8-oxo-dGTP pyrophosphatase MutT (NUDIX family)